VVAYQLLKVFKGTLKIENNTKCLINQVMNQKAERE